MPLAFESLSHGTVAFGFFNIESDMLLLERYFFFASDFCAMLRDIAKLHGKTPAESTLEIHEIDDPKKVGDLMGAIRGVRHFGFIGDTYLKFPFPEKPEDFKQKPYGFENRRSFEKMIEPYAKRKTIGISADPAEKRVQIGLFLFDIASFHQLLDYVWRGGYPRWKNEERPDYVLGMKSDVEGSNLWLFENLFFR